MIASIYRFHGNNSVRRVYKNGAIVRGPMFALKFTPSRRPGYRVSVVVSKKVNKSAVVRNRIRRRIYELVRLRQTRFNQPFDMVITAFHDTLMGMPIEDITNQLDKQLYQAQLLDK